MTRPSAPNGHAAAHGAPHVREATPAYWVPDFAHAKPLPAGYVWCSLCQASKLPHEHDEGT